MLWTRDLASPFLHVPATPVVTISFSFFISQGPAGPKGAKGATVSEPQPALTSAPSLRLDLALSLQSQVLPPVEALIPSLDTELTLL